MFITDLVVDSTATVASASSVEPDHQSLLDSVLEKHKGVFAPLPNGVPVRDVGLGFRVVGYLILKAPT